MALYQYPYVEFARDFDAVLPSPNAVALDEMQRLMLVRRYIRATYPSDVDRAERGGALGMCWAFLCRHMDEFDTGGLAVRGDETSIISEHLLRAVHALICEAALRPSDNWPTPAQVRRLAERYGRDDEGKQPNA